jgi:hypothetical protein
MNRRALASLLLVFALTPSSSQAQDAPRPAAQQPQLPPLGAPAGSFGAGVTLTEATPLARLVADPKAFEGKQVRVDGEIAEVCHEKGCWLMLTDGERRVRVRFKNYGFFVPRDSGGRKVIVQGEVVVDQISEALARHYAEDAGHPERAAEIHGAQQVVAFVATGVEVLALDGAPLAAQGTPEVVAALTQRLAAAQRLAPGAAKVEGVDGALRALRAAPGGRTAEVSLSTELPEWIVFGAAGGEAFAHGWAVRRATGEVVRF